jgi:threonyl-tRNA synthetase
MEEIKITFPGGSVGVYHRGTAVKDLILSWNKEILASTVAAKLNDTLVDLSHSIEKDSSFVPIDISSKEGLAILRHSISHVMAQAVQDSFQGVQVCIGPSIEEGFYYDFEYAAAFTPEDFEKIEAKMQGIVAADYPFLRKEVSREEAVALFREKSESYKVELINDLPKDVKMVSLYIQGGYVDLCRGPHIPSTGMIKAFKLLSVAEQHLPSISMSLRRRRKGIIVSWGENWISSR